MLKTLDANTSSKESSAEFLFLSFLFIPKAQTGSDWKEHYEGAMFILFYYYFSQLGVKINEGEVAKSELHNEVIQLCLKFHLHKKKDKKSFLKKCKDNFMGKTL